MSNWLVVGISGATCSGKTLLSKELKVRYPGAIVFSMDDFFFDVESDRHVRVPEVDHINFEILSSLDIDLFLQRIHEALSGICDGMKKILIIEGFLILNESRVMDLCHLKFFIEIDKATCWARRSIRTYDPPDPPGYFDLCVWPYYLKHFAQVKESVVDVHYLDGRLDPHVVLLDVVRVIDTALNLKSQNS